MRAQISSPRIEHATHLLAELFARSFAYTETSGAQDAKRGVDGDK